LVMAKSRSPTSKAIKDHHVPGFMAT
jgi:hypothetical protein